MSAEYRNPYAERDRRRTMLRICEGKTVKYARACTASNDYLIVRVPLKRGVEDLSNLVAWEEDFVTHNVTPAEHAAKQETVGA